MTIYTERVQSASIDKSTLDAVRRSTSFARRALRARSAFFWSTASEPAVLVARAGEAGDIDADALATLFATQVLAATGPIALGATSAPGKSCTLGGVAVRSGGGTRGVLFVADSAPRAFDAEDLALMDEVGAGLALDLERDACGAARGPAPDQLQNPGQFQNPGQVQDPDKVRYEEVGDELQVPLSAIMTLSDAVVRDATSVRSISAKDYLAVADHLVGFAARLRELAGAEARSPASPLMPEREGASFAARGTGGARILLADDLDLNRKLISDMLTIEGHHVDCVADGAAAVQAVQEKAYDLVLMDMIMPEMDGIAATRAIRALPSPVCRVPIVALTANTFREQLDSCIEAGMDATLTKPMTFEALTRAVTSWARARPAAA